MRAAFDLFNLCRHTFRLRRFSTATLVALAMACSPAISAAQDQPMDDEIGVIEAPEAVARDAFDGSAAADMPSAGSFSLAPTDMPRAKSKAGGSALMIGIPVVVELFTAQGCSSCPAADQLVAALADQPDVLTLSWHVDYWDYLGWPDGFARPEHTLRQEAYASAAGERGVYTPQIIIDGQDTLIGVRQTGLLALIDEHASRPPAVLITAAAEQGAYVVDLTPRAAIAGGVDLMMIRYLPRREVAIDAGENSGSVMVYRNIVIGAERISEWPARTPIRLTIRPGDSASGAYPEDTRHALIVQQSLGDDRPGSILAALRLD